MKKSILFSLMVIGAVAAMITAATSASFSDTVTSSANAFTTGTLNVALDSKCPTGGSGADTVLGGPCEIGTVTFSGTGTAGNLKPGDSIKHTFTVHNAGSLDISGFTITATKDAGALWACDGVNSPTVTATAISGGITAGGADKTFDVTIAMPAGAGNSCQAKTGQVTVQVVAAQ